MRPAPSTFRPALRAAAQRRFASTSTEAAQKKAQDALGAAQRGAEKAWAQTQKLMGPLGERFGSLLGAYRQPLTYNLSVAREVLKQIYIAERARAPASLAQVSSAYSTLFARARSPAYWRELLRSGEWARVGVYAVEAYGIYKIGEIVGRRSLVGYTVRD
ncbi:hypothetical protein EVG20_g4953 [Dentipellis fragilis]|uniref:ATP synthase subunit n=1 Tax=Dentipellis fragilis TaxID=205917 RepID=A0A4Y9YWL3_9AGAM|nr:hypothetical protein EVG20_g4953 [Dentipellis fragilis]